MNYTQINTAQAKTRIESNRRVYAKEFGAGELGKLDWINFNNCTAFICYKNGSGRMIELYDTRDGEKNIDHATGESAKGDTEYYIKTKTA